MPAGNGVWVGGCNGGGGGGSAKCKDWNIFKGFSSKPQGSGCMRDGIVMDRVLTSNSTVVSVLNRVMAVFGIA